MAPNEILVKLLNNLIEINNDRIAGYDRAIDDTKTHDADLQAIFKSMINDSKHYVQELTREVIKLGGEFSTETTNKGKVYRVWMDVKANFTNNDREAILDSCVFGETETQDAYTQALSSKEIIPPQVYTIIAEQQASLKTAHDLIKKFRNDCITADAR